jgi:hypothetical protein
VIEGLVATGLPLLAIGGVGVVTASIALGIRHGIDWDHIAAITDITSTTAAMDEKEAALVKEPALMLTDEKHHAIGHEHEEEDIAPVSSSTVAVAVGVAAPEIHAHEALQLHHTHQHHHDGGSPRAGVTSMFEKQRPALLLGSLYAVGHGFVVFVLGVIAIVARGFLPDWIDPIMEKVVGVTLLFLAAYLFYSLYRFFRGGEDFVMRSRWMLVFTGIRNAWESVRARLFGRPQAHVHEAERYGVRTALGIGMIHGVGAETGTQALVIAAAAGASNQATAVIALLGFIFGLLISNSAVTVLSTASFVSASQRKWVYVGAGALAAVFSLFIGLVFVFEMGDVLPALDPYTEWIGGGET